MKKIVYITLFMLPLVCIAQSSREEGKVFKTNRDYPTEDLDKSGEIVVTRTLYGLIFEDDKIHKEYKKMVERFFDKSFFSNKYDKLGVKYRLKVEKKALGDIYIENEKVGNIKDIPTSN
ncbi:MAG: hypothetical protein ACTTJI_06555 [Capnocytophaga sp.]|uniref:hypothetical protein n=1 Tax=Capnocytophaga sp. TaxID=44737 RepID=UPI003F9EBBC2